MKKSSSLIGINNQEHKLNFQLPPVKRILNNNELSNLTKKKSILKKPIEMTKSYNFNISNALEYTCNTNKSNANFCGQCNSCQIINHLNHLKHWFDRASHISLKKFLIGLVTRINNIKIYKYLNDLLKPLTDSKDFVYARNKFIPSLDEDHFKATNNRCLDDAYINKQINLIWNWYSNSSNYVKLNFMLSLFKKCDQALVAVIMLQIKSIIDSTKAHLNDLVHEEDDFDEFKIKEAFQENDDPEIICEALDDEDSDDDNDDDNFSQLKKDDEEVKKIFNHTNNQSIKSMNQFRGAKQVDFIRNLPVHLSKSILSSLDKISLHNCLFVCKYWTSLVKEVNKEAILHKVLQDDMMLLKVISFIHFIL